MTDNHTELCERLRTEIEAFKKAGVNPGELVPALAHIEELELEREQAVAEAHGYRDRIAELEKERDALNCIAQNESAKVQRCVKILSSIHALLQPPDVKLEDGRLMRFTKTDFQVYCYIELSKRIRAIPDELDAALKADKETRS